MSQLSGFTGTGVAVVTPFNRYQNVDFKSLSRIIDHLIAGGVEYLVMLGTTGESVTLTHDEQVAVIENAKEFIDGRVPMVVGVGGNSTQEVIRKLRMLPLDGVDAILSVSPYYNKPSQKGIVQHYKSVAAASPLPIILYNVPGRTGSNMAAETCLELAHDMDNIIAVKEASGNFAQIMNIIQNKPEGFLVISGDDALTLPLIAAGADGVISVVANVLPKHFSDMVRLSLKNNMVAARELHYKILDFGHALFAEGSPGGAKAALETMGLCQNILRLPLVKVSKQHNAVIADLLKDITG